ncbi:hypothetical protein [Rhodoblastus sp.]|uniref:hypothetical protein n=1 Tax=Rhodoblastus sp. TaxID=1962975 RepID=UPI003F9A02F9
MRKFFLLAAALALLVDLASATDVLAKKRHRRQPSQAAVSREAPPRSQMSHPGGGSNSK